MSKEPNVPVTFVRGSKESVVWDPETDRPLVTFIDGLFETDDPDIIERLRILGYRTVRDYGGRPPESGFDGPDRGPIIDVEETDVRPAKSESQALMNHKKEELRRRRSRKKQQEEDGDDVIYSPKKKKKAKKKKETKKKKTS